MKKLPQKELDKKGTVNPVLAGLPDDIKTVEWFDKIEQAIARVMYSDHTHATVKGFVKCKRCIAKTARKQAMLKEFGFKTPEQYFTWKKIMTIIKNKSNFEL